MLKGFFNVPGEMIICMPEERSEMSYGKEQSYVRFI